MVVSFLFLSLCSDFHGSSLRSYCKHSLRTEQREGKAEVLYFRCRTRHCNSLQQWFSIRSTCTTGYTGVCNSSRSVSQAREGNHGTDWRGSQVQGQQGLGSRAISQGPTPHWFLQKLSYTFQFQAAGLGFQTPEMGTVIWNI